MTARYYHPSNRAPRAGLALLPLAALLVLPVAATYAWLLAVVPFGCGPAVLGAACLGLGWPVRWAGLRGKIRHPRLMAWAGAGIGLLAWYAQWAGWLYIEGYPLTGADPVNVFKAIAGVLAEQTSPLLAWGLGLCWVVECGVLVYVTMLVGQRQASAPFCEASGEWARKIEVPVQFAYIAQPGAVRSRLESDPAQLEALLVPCPEDYSGNHARLTLYRCAGPDSFATLRNYVTMAPEQAPLPNDVRRTLEAAGEVEYYGEDDEPVVEWLRVPMPDPEGLLRRWKQAARTLSAATP